MTFSVNVTNDNYRRSLPRAVTSVLRQTQQDLELIVVEDGSTDGSLADIESLPDRLVLVRTNRLGHAWGRLEAFRHARDRYVYFIDADNSPSRGS